MARDWYIQRGDIVSGPFTGTELRRQAAAGELKTADLICQSREGPWHPAAHFRGIFEANTEGTATASGPPRDFSDWFEVLNSPSPTPASRPAQVSRTPAAQSQAARHRKPPSLPPKHPGRRPTATPLIAEPVVERSRAPIVIALLIIALIVPAVIAFDRFIFHSERLTSGSAAKSFGSSADTPIDDAGETKPRKAAVTVSTKNDSAVARSPAGAAVEAAASRTSPQAGPKAVVGVAHEGQAGPTATAPPAAAPPQAPIHRRLLSSREVTVAVMPSVATLTVRGKDHNSTGSGFLMGDAATIVTCFHVVEGARTIEVRFPDGFRASATGFVCALPDRDLAVIRLDKPKPDGTALPLADSIPQQGSDIFAFGAPQGLANSVSNGIVSAVRTHGEIAKNLEIDKGDLAADCRVLQVTAPISTGNSGGPSVNEFGEVVGVNSFILYPDSAQNLNFAVAGDSIAQAMEALHDVKPFADLPDSEVGRQTLVAAAADLKAMQRGDVMRYHTFGKNGAHGVDLSIVYPASWKTRIGSEERGTIKECYRADGRGGVQMRLHILPTQLRQGFRLSIQEINEALLAAIKPPGGSEVIKKQNPRPGNVEPIASSTFALQSNDLFSVMQITACFKDDCIVLLECASVGSRGEQSLVRKRFDAYEPTFQKIVDSLKANL